MSSEKELLRMVSDPAADLAYRTFAAQLLQELLLRRIAGKLGTLVSLTIFVLLVQGCSAIVLLL
jgi:hypothetical protein